MSFGTINEQNGLIPVGKIYSKTKHNTLGSEERNKDYGYDKLQDLQGYKRERQV